MLEQKRYRLGLSVALMLSLQACAFLTPKPIEPERQQAALQRWNLCLERFDKHAAQYCEGHKRDVVASFPVHLTNQVDALLSEQVRVTRTTKLLKTGSRAVSEHSENGISKPPFTP